MNQMNNAPLKIVRGETLVLEVPVVKDAAPFDLTNCLLFFTLRAQLVPSDPNDAAALLRKDIGAGITIINAAAGMAQVTLSPTDTESLPVDVDLFYDIKLKQAAGAMTDIARGIIQVAEQVTFRTS